MRNRWDRGGRPHPPDGMGWGCSRRRRGTKAKKKRKHLPAGLGPGPQGSPTHHERSVGILIHCRSTGERERKSFFLSLSVRPCPSIPAGVTVEAEGAAAGPASVPRTNVDTGARAPPPQFIGRFGAAPTVRCKNLQPIRDPRSLHDQHLDSSDSPRRVETRSCDEVGDKFWLGWFSRAARTPLVK